MTNFHNPYIIAQQRQRTLDSIRRLLFSIAFTGIALTVWVLFDKC